MVHQWLSIELACAGNLRADESDINTIHVMICISLSAHDCTMNLFRQQVNYQEKMASKRFAVSDNPA